MPIFRTEKTSDYAVIAKHHLKNRALSYKAKGLLTFMLSVPEDWDYSLSGLAILASDGVDGVRSGIRELEKHGYLTRRRIRDAGGKLGDVEYTIHEIPQLPNGGKPNDEPNLPPTDSPTKPSKPTSPISPTSEKPTLEKPILENPTLVQPTSEKPILDFPTLVKPTLEKPMLENPTQLSNKVLSIKELSINELNNKKTNPACVSESGTDSCDHSQLSLGHTNIADQQAECLTVETAQGTGKPVIHTMTLVEHEQQFELFWQIYPRKAGKKTAKKAWLDIKPDEIMFSAIMMAINTANQYWKHQGISLKHIPHPSTWLNEERWDDEFPAEQLSSPYGYDSVTPDGNGKGGVHNAINGANYTIGGEDDPYRAIMSSQGVSKQKIG